MLALGPKLAWTPPVVLAVASRGDGVPEVLEAVERHRRHLEASGEARRVAEARLKDEAADLVGEWARGEARRLLDREPALAERLLSGGSPYSAAEEILTRQGGQLVPEGARTE